ncbi:L-type lectin-domain containing receptor kinase IX.1-like [Vitis vinifera]|uniref:L-type lectin-domain containing receptor kinase IX.1-like n=1 Tax=Vitis vinifera TaxID=29760 RepID=UPI0008FFDEE8|nr:L-type lectin-domain containing receptor kinase IX.1-like [Vitis vinifera]|eukprot:XP_019077095.1 PREDICTED: L-type lectin-domain containing receptor kinase IX.1-like [Vitis vinifera]
MGILRRLRNVKVSECDCNPGAGNELSEAAPAYAKNSSLFSDLGRSYFKTEFGGLFYTIDVISSNYTNEEIGMYNQPEFSSISISSIMYASRDVGSHHVNADKLAAAAKNFPSSTMLGQGGTGRVYKGFLTDSGRIERIWASYEHAKEDFMAELKIMSQLECRNVVSLIGWCIDQGELLLVYDYMFNGSLDKYLFGNNRMHLSWNLFGNNRMHLSWNLRYNVVLSLASALLYLHEDSGQCIPHRDVKSANVMLDFNFNAKLGDFGAAQFLDQLSNN